MATVVTLLAQVKTNVAGAGYTAQAAGTRTELRVAPNTRASHVRIIEVETVQTGSNQSVQVVTLEIEIVERAAGSAPAQIQTAEGVAHQAAALLSARAWWVAMSEVRDSDVEFRFSTPIERVGDVIRFILAVDVILEA